MRLRHLLFALASLLEGSLSGATPVRAQRPDCPIDSASYLRTIDLYLSLATPDSIQEPRRQGYLAIALSVASAFTQPHPLSLPGWPGTFLPSQNSIASPIAPWFGLGGHLILELSRTGGLKPERVRALSGSPELARALTQATLRTDSLKAFPALAEDQYPRDGRVVFDIRESLEPTGDKVVIAKVRLHALEITTPPVPDRPSLPKYPVAALGRRPVEGYAYYQFVIDPDGHPVPESFTLLDANFREFAEAAYAALRQTTYRPAFVGRCPVASLVHQRVAFKLAH
jgi:hypothetical protein